MTKETFAPSVLLKNGETCTPKGWEWVSAFALNGCEWAIKEVDTEEFREIMRKDAREKQIKKLKDSIAECEKKLIRLKRKLDEIND